MRAHILCTRPICLILAISSFVMAQTPQQISSGWAALSGNQGGRVVFGRNNQIWVMDLTTGESESIAEFGLAYTQFGLSASYRFSPDGTRILAQNDQAVVVMNADGSNLRTIWQGGHPWDLIACDWDGDSAIVYSTFTEIVRTTIRSDNGPGVTTRLITAPPLKGYCSVEKSGPYLCYINITANQPTGGYHRPCITNLFTGVTQEMVARNENGCTIRLRKDSSGVCIINKWNHVDPALIMDYSKRVIDQLPAVNNQGLSGMRWSNQTDFMVHNGDRIVNTADYAWIRKVSTKSHLFLGTTIYWPDLWIGTVPKPNRAALPKFSPTAADFRDSLMVSITTTTPNATIHYTLNATEPTPNSLIYTGPFTIWNSSTIRAKAFAEGMEPSNTAEKTYVKGALIRAENPPNVVPGLHYSYYEGSWTVIPNLYGLTPKSSGIVDSFTLSPRLRNDNFAMLYSGYISIIRSGTYTFYLRSDEGSKLFISNTVVIDNDGVHTSREVSGSIGLAAGRHPIVVAYFEVSGPEELVVSYEGGGYAKRPVPASVLYRTTPELAYSVISPGEGDVFRIGDTLPITWRFFNGTNYSTVVTLSLDGGITFPVHPFTRAFVQNSENGKASWVIPDNPSHITDEAVVMVSMYNNTALNAISAPFRIVAGTAQTGRRKGIAHTLATLRVGSQTLRIPSAVNPGSQVQVFSMSGKLVRSCALNEIPKGGIDLPSGMTYIVRIREERESAYSKLFTVTR